MKTSVIIIAIAALALCAAPAQVPSILNYQGRVTVGGTNLTTNAALFKFALVDGSGSTVYWKNDGAVTAGEPATAVTTAVAQGLYSTLLGDTSLANMAAIPTSVFTNSNVNLRVWFSPGSGNPFVQLTPDQRLGASGYALRAAAVDLPGENNTASGTFAVVGGGVDNTAGGYASTVGGGNDNTSGTYAFVGGGFRNTASGNSSTVGGGYSNTASAFDSTASGGRENTASGLASTIGGGQRNMVSSNYATVGGGFQNTASAFYATIAGGSYNAASGYASTVGGGSTNTASATNAVVGGGLFNTASADYSTVGGGSTNAANGVSSTVAGGRFNIANGYYATVAGGDNNVAGEYFFIGEGYYQTVSGGSGNRASGYASTVGGGLSNRTTGSAPYSTIGGGRSNVVEAWFATVPGGTRSYVTHDGSFVWGGDIDEDTRSFATNTFTVRAEGGARFYTANGTTTGVRLLAGAGSWTSLSDRNAKANFQRVNATNVLAKVAAMPVMTWNYKTQDENIRHIGPTAQDFRAAFGVGASDTGITTVDADGVALAAIQGLVEELKLRDKTIEELKAKLDAVEQRLASFPPAP